MKKRRAPEPAASYGFFHAMVIMGGSMAVGCGGVATDSRHSGLGDGPDGAAGGSNTGTGGWSVLSTGGVHSIVTAVTGGAAGTGVAANFGGGANTGGAAAGVDAGFLPCAPEQWSCGSGSGAQCSSVGSGVVLPSGCVCDAERPTSAAQCASGQTFVCRQGVIGETFSGDVPTIDMVPFECSCVTASPDCRACNAVFGPATGRDYLCDSSAPDAGVGDVLCGCAVVYLR